MNTFGKTPRNSQTIRAMLKSWWGDFHMERLRMLDVSLRGMEINEYVLTWDIQWETPLVLAVKEYYKVH